MFGLLTNGMNASYSKEVQSKSGKPRHLPPVYRGVAPGHHAELSGTQDSDFVLIVQTGLKNCQTIAWFSP